MNFPEKLKEKDNWIVHLDKIPYIPGTNQKASVTDSKTWKSYQEALTSYNRNKCIGVGLGFVFSPFDNFIGIDLDHCVKDGLIEKWAEEIIYNINSYTEFSFSGTGFHIILESGKLPESFGTGKRIESPKLEIYSANRYFTMTGNVFNKVSTEVESREDELNELFKQYWSTKKLEDLKKNKINFKNMTRFKYKELPDEEVLKKMFNSKKGSYIKKLFDGDASDFYDEKKKKNDFSEADYVLCKYLGYWTNYNKQQMNRLFRQSGLMRSKWDGFRNTTKKTYGEMTIDKVLSSTPIVAPQCRPEGEHSNSSLNRLLLEYEKEHMK